LLVNVSAINGCQLDLILEAEAKGADLKAAIAEHWKVPCLCQRLCVGTLVVEDEQLLTSLHQEDSPVLSVTLVKSLDEAVKLLSSHGCGNRQAKQSSLEAVVQLLPHQVDQWAADLLCCALEDVDFHAETRCAALKLLSRVAPLGDKRSLAIGTQRVADRSCMVRRAAIRLLRRMCPEGSETIVRQLSSCSSRRPKEVMLSALHAIYVVAPGSERGQHTAEAVSLFLQVSDAEVRSMATKVLSKLVANGNIHANVFLRQCRFGGMSSFVPKDSCQRASLNMPPQRVAP